MRVGSALFHLTFSRANHARGRISSLMGPFFGVCHRMRCPGPVTLSNQSIHKVPQRANNNYTRPSSNMCVCIPYVSIWIEPCDCSFDPSHLQLAPLHICPSRTLVITSALNPKLKIQNTIHCTSDDHHRSCGDPECSAARGRCHPRQRAARRFLKA